MLQMFIEIVVIVALAAFTWFAFAMHRWQQRLQANEMRHQGTLRTWRAVEEDERNSYLARIRINSPAEVGRRLGEAFTASMAGQPVQRPDLSAAIDHFSR